MKRGYRLLKPHRDNGIEYAAGEILYLHEQAGKLVLDCGVAIELVYLPKHVRAALQSGPDDIGQFHAVRSAERAGFTKRSRFE